MIKTTAGDLLGVINKDAESILLFADEGRLIVDCFVERSVNVKSMVGVDGSLGSLMVRGQPFCDALRKMGESEEITLISFNETLRVESSSVVADLELLPRGTYLDTIGELWDSIPYSSFKAVLKTIRWRIAESLRNIGIMKEEDL